MSMSIARNSQQGYFFLPKLGAAKSAGGTFAKDLRRFLYSLLPLWSAEGQLRERPTPAKLSIFCLKTYNLRSLPQTL